MKSTKLRVLAAVLFTFLCYGLAVEIANASDDECRGGHSQCGHDDDGGDIDIDVDAGGGEGGAGGEANADSDASASADGTQTVTFEGNRTPGRGYVGGGSSSADHQKVRAISGGWLTGMAAIRWDATDKELRSLHRADNLRARGLIEAADQLECSAKVIWKAVGGSKVECVTLLSAERLLLAQASSRDVEQDALIEALQLQLQAIYEKEIPQAQETHAELAMDIQRQQAEAPAYAAEEVAELTKMVEDDRRYERQRINSFKMIAQQSLDTIAEAESKGYAQQVEEPAMAEEAADDDEF